MTAHSLCRFFKRELPRLESTYMWKIPNNVGFEQADESFYMANVRFKQQLHDKWHATDHAGRLHLAGTIVRGWGGIKRNAPETLASYVRQIEASAPTTPLKGVASYSKIYAIVHPARYAIYDSRVAACLNAIQVNERVVEGVAFNYVSGRNNVIGNAAKKIGFTQRSEFSVRSLVAAGWTRIPRDGTYEAYLQLLSDCRRHFPGYEVRDLEMALFACAELECSAAMRRNETI
jgi:hypothetical protein